MNIRVLFVCLSVNECKLIRDKLSKQMPESKRVGMTLEVEGGRRTIHFLSIKQLEWDGLDFHEMMLSVGVLMSSRKVIQRAIVLGGLTTVKYKRIEDI